MSVCVKGVGGLIISAMPKNRNLGFKKKKKNRTILKKIKEAALLKITAPEQPFGRCDGGAWESCVLACLCVYQCMCENVALN